MIFSDDHRDVHLSLLSTIGWELGALGLPCRLEIQALVLLCYRQRQASTENKRSGQPGLGGSKSLSYSLTLTSFFFHLSMLLPEDQIFFEEQVIHI